MAAITDSPDKRKGIGKWLSSATGIGSAKDASKMDQWVQKDDSAYQSLWSPDVASAMGYGKKGRSGSAFQWWILVLSSIVAFGSFIAWCVFVFRARDATDSAIAALRLDLAIWQDLKAILLATAICFPIFAALAVAVSLWRAFLARRLNIHAPDTKWMRNCKAWQTANVVSNVLLYGMFILMVVSIAATVMWSYTARAGHYGAYYAIKYVDPVWTSVSSVVNASESLVDSFVGLTSALPAVGGRKLSEYDPVTGRTLIARQLTQADVDAMPQHVVEAGVAAARSLQQLPDLVNGLGTLLNGAAAAMTGSAGAVNSISAISSQALKDLGVPQLLPDGSSNPLFQTLSSVTNAVQQQVLNRTGCPTWCVDLRDQRWIQDGCICNLDRVKAAYPYLGPIYSNTVPAIAMVFVMMVAATWLLLHAASQWARTRSEVKLLQRLPNAAQLAARLQQHQQQQHATNGSGYDVAKSLQTPLPSV